MTVKRLRDTDRNADSTRIQRIFHTKQNPVNKRKAKAYRNTGCTAVRTVVLYLDFSLVRLNLKETRRNATSSVRQSLVRTPACLLASLGAAITVQKTAQHNTLSQVFDAAQRRARLRM